MPGQYHRGFSISPSHLGFEESAAAPTGGARPGRRGPEGPGDEVAPLLENADPLSGGVRFEEGETRDRQIPFTPVRGGLGEPGLQLPEAGRCDTVFAAGRTLGRAAPADGDEAAAAKPLESRIDLRQRGVPSEGGILIEARFQIPPGRARAGEKAEKKVGE